MPKITPYSLYKRLKSERFPVFQAPFFKNRGKTLEFYGFYAIMLIAYLEFYRKGDITYE